MLKWLKNLNYWELSKLTEKYLGAQASSGALERMFSLAGHIYQK